MSVQTSSWLRRMSFTLLVALVPGLADAGEVRFNPTDGHAYHPVWSADGKYVAFEVNRYDGGTIDLFVSQVAGAIAKDGVKISLPGAGSQFGGSGGQVVVNPTWHKDGMAIFEGSNQSGLYRLYVYQPGGASAIELLPSTKAPGNLTFPATSKDGTQFAFVSDQTGHGDIRSWDRSSGAVAQLTKTDSTEAFPLFSQDGKTLAFTRKVNNTEDIFLLDWATKTEKALTGGGGTQSRPAFGANGSIVYFVSDRGLDIWDIAVVDSAGQNKKVLAKDVDLPLRARPTLTPDGQWVAWVARDPLQATKVMVAKIDGSKTVEIKTEFARCFEPALTVQAGRTLLAYTYIPDKGGADWRHLFVVDITDNLAQ